MARTQKQSQEPEYPGRRNWGSCVHERKNTRECPREKGSGQEKSISGSRDLFSITPILTPNER